MDLVANLVAIGFTENEARVYLELLRNHPANGYQISKESGVPRSMVYDALGRLHNRGAVLETYEDKATLYRPLPPEMLLQQHAEEQQRLTKTLSEGLTQLYTARTEDYLWSINGQGPVLSYAAHMIREAHSDLKLVLADAQVHGLRPALDAARDRGLTISALLTGQADLHAAEVVRHPPLESELQHLEDLFIVLADDQEVLIGTAQQETTATVTRNRSQVFVAGQFIWMELFTHRILAQFGADLLERLSPADRQILESLNRVDHRLRPQSQS